MRFAGALTLIILFSMSAGCSPRASSGIKPSDRDILWACRQLHQELMAKKILISSFYSVPDADWKKYSALNQVSPFAVAVLVYPA